MASRQHLLAALGGAVADVPAARERARLRRLRWLLAVLGPLAAWLWLRWLLGDARGLALPSLGDDAGTWLPGVVLLVMLGLVLVGPVLAAGRSPHVLYRPAEIAVTFGDVKGAGAVREEVERTLDLFLSHATFHARTGGTARRAVLFEGPPGTGKTYMAKALAREAGVPFLFVSSSAFQSMYYGQTNRKIRSYFRALRRAARTEGGAIGFIEEIDAIAGARSGMGSSSSREGISGVVNELLVQLQSFDEPTKGQRLWGWASDRLNLLLPPDRQLRKAHPRPANVLVIGATNRVADLDPALVRPGRFDRSIHFGLPSRTERREIIDYYLERRAHAAELDDETWREALASSTIGYSPVMIEHLFDEALVWALRRGAPAFTWADLQQAKLTEEVGLRQPVEYTEAERERIATHEAGHATVAWLVGRGRRLDILTIVKRRDALGLLGHSAVEERFTQTRSEIVALVQIAMGGLVAEELAYGEAGTGPAGDLQAATTAAATMVGSLGMGGSLISYDAMTVAGAENVVAKVLSTDHGRAAVDEVLDRARADVEAMLRGHRHVLDALRDALLERREMVGPEILEVIAAAEDAAAQPAV